MDKHRFFNFLFAALLLSVHPLHQSLGQGTLNPDISVIPRFILQTDDSRHLAEGRREFGWPDFSFEELEIGIQSALNPYARADIFLSMAGPDVESARLGLEEAYATILKGLPLDLNVRFGKYRVEFGKLNTVHPHARVFVTQPLVHERFLGEEGLNDIGISVSTLLPTADLYTRLTVDLLRGASIGEAAGIGDTSAETPPYAWTARLMTFFPLDDHSDMEIGLSGLTGIHDPYAGGRFWYLNGDVKYKYTPDVYTALTLQGEFLLSTRKVPGNSHLPQHADDTASPGHSSVTTSGLYIFADWRFERIFSVGGRFDWSQSPYSAENRARGFALWFGYYPVEETLAFRLQYHRTTTSEGGFSQSVNTIALQMLFSLGPHKAHVF